METKLENDDLTTASIPAEKRSRKLVSRLSEVYDKTFESQSERKHKAVNGTGIKLGDILRIQNASQRGKLTGELAKNMHLICYRSKGKANRRVTAIKHFNGFELEELDKRVAVAEKMKMDELKLIGDLLNVPQLTSVVKKDLAKSIVDYLQCPSETSSIVFRSTPLKQRRPKGALSKTRSLSRLSVHKRKRPSITLRVPPDSKATTIAPIQSLQSPQTTLHEQEPQQVGKEVIDNGDGFVGDFVTDDVLRDKIEAELSVVDVDTTSVNQVVDRVLEKLSRSECLVSLKGELIQEKRQHVKKLVKQIICEHIQI